MNATGLGPRQERARSIGGIDGFQLTTDPPRSCGNNGNRPATAERAPGEPKCDEIVVDGGDVEMRTSGRVVNFGTVVDLTPGMTCP